MGFIRKLGKKVGKGIKKLGRALSKGWKKVWGGIKKIGAKVGKVFNKLGPIGHIGMMLLMPYVPVWWTNLGTWASGLTASANVFVKGFGYAMKGLYHAGNVAGKVYSTVTGAVKNVLNVIPGGQGVGLGDRIGNFFNKSMEFAQQTLGLPDPASMYTDKSLKFLEYQQANPDAGLSDFQQALDSGELSNTLTDQGQAIFEQIASAPDGSYDGNFETDYKQIVSQGETPELYFDEASGQYKFVTQSSLDAQRLGYDPKTTISFEDRRYPSDYFVEEGVINPKYEGAMIDTQTGELVTTGQDPNKGFDFAETYNKVKNVSETVDVVRSYMDDDEGYIDNRGYVPSGAGLMMAQNMLGGTQQYSTLQSEFAMPYSTYQTQDFNSIYQNMMNQFRVQQGVDPIQDMLNAQGYGTNPGYVAAGQVGFDYLGGQYG